MERNFWQQGNSVKVNSGEHLYLFLRNKRATVNFHREQGNMSPPPPGRPSFLQFVSSSPIKRINGRVFTSHIKMNPYQKCFPKPPLFTSFVQIIEMSSTILFELLKKCHLLNTQLNITIISSLFYALFYHFVKPFFAWHKIATKHTMKRRVIYNHRVSKNEVIS